MDAWQECFHPELWWQVCADLGIDLNQAIHEARHVDQLLPWDHVNVKKGREYLEKEQQRSVVQLGVMAHAREDRPTEHFVVRP